MPATLLTKMSSSAAVPPRCLHGDDQFDIVVRMLFWPLSPRPAWSSRPNIGQQRADLSLCLYRARGIMSATALVSSGESTFIKLHIPLWSPRWWGCRAALVTFICWIVKKRKG